MQLYISQEIMHICIIIYIIQWNYCNLKHILCSNYLKFMYCYAYRHLIHKKYVLFITELHYKTAANEMDVVKRQKCHVINVNSSPK